MIWFPFVSWNITGYKKNYSSWPLYACGRVRCVHPVQRLWQGRDDGECPHTAHLQHCACFPNAARFGVWAAATGMLHRGNCTLQHWCHGCVCVLHVCLHCGGKSASKAPASCHKSAAWEEWGETIANARQHLQVRKSSSSMVDLDPRGMGMSGKQVTPWHSDAWREGSSSSPQRELLQMLEQMNWYPHLCGC